MKFADIEVGKDYEVGRIGERARVLEVGTFTNRVDRSGRHSFRAHWVDVPTKGARVHYVDRSTGEPRTRKVSQRVECEGCIGRGTVTVTIPSFPTDRKVEATCANCKGVKTVESHTVVPHIEWLASKDLVRTWSAREAQVNAVKERQDREQRARLEAEQLAPQLTAALQAVGLNAYATVNYNTPGRITIGLSNGNAAELTHLLGVLKELDEVVG